MKSINSISSMNDYINLLKKVRPNNAKAGEIISTGNHELNLALDGGFKKNELYILKGRPSSGKTSFITNLTCYLGECGYKTLLFTMQDDIEKMTQKMLANMSGVHYQNVRSGLLSELDFALVSCAYRNGAGNNISLVWEINKIEDIINEACQLKVSSGLDVIIIDYLELIEKYGKHYNKIIHTLKNVATQLDVAVLVVSQIRDDSILSCELDLEHSDADALLYLQRDEIAADEENNKYRSCRAKLCVYNHTMDSLAEVTLTFIPTLLRFDSV